MRLIALLGVLFIVASCSDSDTPENFGVSCYLDDKTNRTFFEFDFDKNKVTKKQKTSKKLPKYFGSVLEVE